MNGTDCFHNSHGRLALLGSNNVLLQFLREIINHAKQQGEALCTDSLLGTLVTRAQSFFQKMHLNDRQ